MALITDPTHVENLKKLVEALRSGKYAQTRNYLHTSTGYCCLGVACEVAGLNEWQVSKEKDRKRAAAIYSLNGASVATPPLSVSLDFGLDTIVNDVDSQTELIDKLISMNDHGRSFDEIATYIETLIA